MVNNLLNILAFADTQTPGYITEETLATGINTTVIGMGVVFMVLVVLFLLFKIIGAIDTATSNRPPKEKKQKKQKEQAEAAPIAPVASTGIDEQTIAAITAAVEVCCGKPARELKFTAIRRNNNAWNSSGLADVINSRQQNL